MPNKQTKKRGGERREREGIKHEQSYIYKTSQFKRRIEAQKLPLDFINNHYKYKHETTAILVSHDVSEETKRT